MSLLGLGEFHAFGAAGQRFLYLVPSAAVFALDEPASALIDALDDQRLSREDLLAAVAPRFPDTALDETLTELEQVRAVGPVAAPPSPMPTIIPLGVGPRLTRIRRPFAAGKGRRCRPGSHRSGRPMRPDSTRGRIAGSGLPSGKSGSLVRHRCSTASPTA